MNEYAIWLMGPCEIEDRYQQPYHGSIIGAGMDESRAFEGESAAEVLEQITDFLNDETGRAT